MNILDYKDEISSLIQLAYNEDVRIGDITSISTIPENLEGSAKLLLKEDAVICGLPIIQLVLDVFKAKLTYELYVQDKQFHESGTILGVFKGNVRALLEVERTLLNFLQRMSGVATTTFEYTKELKNSTTKILDTRKTIPGWRALDKYAVFCGGGLNHRFGLWDMILIKDNHIDACGGIEKAIEKAFIYANNSVKIEVETRTIEDVKIAVKTGKVDRIMLDNFSIEKIKEAITFIPKTIEVEVSGGITLKNICQIAKSNVNYISVGAITHSVKATDISFKILH